MLKIFWPFSSNFQPQILEIMLDVLKSFIRATGIKKMVFGEKMCEKTIVNKSIREKNFTEKRFGIRTRNQFKYVKSFLIYSLFVEVKKY